MTAAQLIALAACWAAVAAAAGVATFAFPPRRATWPPHRPRPVPWDWWHVAVAFLILEITPAFVLPLVPADEVLRPAVARLFTTPFALVAVYGLMTAAGARPYQYGLAPIDGRRDWRLGTLGFLVAAPVVYIIYIAALWIHTASTGRAADEHPLLKLARDLPGRWDVWVVVTLVAVVEAPVREELIFRGLLQPILTRPSAGESRTAVGIVVTAALFGSLHLAVWPTPVPLTVLGLALGWLTWRTGRLGPAVVLHALFNAVGVGVMFAR